MKRLELPVGGVFAYTKGEEIPLVLHNVRVVDVTNVPKKGINFCDGCIFGNEPMEFCNRIACTQGERTDWRDVRFVEVKGGEE